MNRPTALALVIVLWAAIYLPGLGSTELKGEEARRALPAITMLETGNWVVPFIGGEPFLRKPPLVNWLIAASFKLTGVRNEWTARLPSALCVLAMGCALVLLSGQRERSFLSPEAGFVAAIMAMTSFGLLAKARFAGAEIEGVYVPLCGIAIVAWLVWWAEQRSAWLVWIVPLALLGVASLAKSPLHLLFFYAIAIAVLWKARSLRELWTVPHGVGLLVMAAIFAAWAVPYFQMTNGAAQVWKDQFAGRVTENVFSWRSWLLNVPRGLSDQLPWLLFAGVVWARRNQGLSRERAVIGGTLAAMAVCFFGLLLVPGVLTRYVLPLGVPFAVLVAHALSKGGNAEGSGLRLWHRVNIGLALVVMVAALVTPFAAGANLEERGFAAIRALDLAAATRAALVAAVALTICAAVVARRSRDLKPHLLAMMSGALLGAAALLYAAAAVRWINRADDLRPLARRIDQAVPAGKRLVLYDPGYQPVIFYLRTPHEYATGRTDEIPRDAEFILIRETKSREKVERQWPAAKLVDEWTAKDGKKWFLLQIPASQNAAESMRPLGIWTSRVPPGRHDGRGNDGQDEDAASLSVFVLATRDRTSRMTAPEGTSEALSSSGIDRL